MQDDNTPPSVRVEISHDVAVLVVDNPPVNAASAEIRSKLLQAVTAIARRSDIVAAVLIGAGKSFIAGSDLREFDRPISEPDLPQVIAAIEDCPKPVVAAIHGSALGGGFEVALGCDGRVATPDAVIGLPEVGFGMIPGAGGTQRLPRMIGRARAIDFIVSGRRVPAMEAHRLGIIDTIVDGDLRAGAIAASRALAGTKRRISERDVPADETPWDGAVPKAPSAAAARAAVDAVMMVGTAPFVAALREERKVFQQLRQSEQAAALRHLFFAERACMRFGRKTDLPDVAKIGIVGAGLMGSSIAAAFALAGIEVAMADNTAELAAAGANRARNLARRAAARVGANGEQAAARLLPINGLAYLGDCEIVVEAIVEDLAAKRAIFAALDRALPPSTAIASNTSYLDIDALAAATSRPSKVAGLHFFSPAHVSKVVEVVSGSSTSPALAAQLARLAVRMGKAPIPAGCAPGFIGNRILAAYRLQSEFLLEEGAFPETVDAAMVEFGMAMGPFAVSDLSGLDIAAARRRQLAATRDPRARYVVIPDRLCAIGRLGQKAGKGWYRYSADARRGQPDPEVGAIILAASAEKGIARRVLDATEIQDRALAAMINEAAHVLADGTAKRAADIDLLLVNGFGFPATKGGPLFWAAQRDRAKVIAMIDRMVAASGFGITRAANLDSTLDSYRTPASNEATSSQGHSA
jgi:3-hydroxyacyl-CoA dehydrogenase